jgi:hypothetical protein
MRTRSCWPVRRNLWWNRRCTRHKDLRDQNKGRRCIFILSYVAKTMEMSPIISVWTISSASSYTMPSSARSRKSNRTPKEKLTVTFPMNPYSHSSPAIKWEVPVVLLVLVVLAPAIDPTSSSSQGWEQVLGRSVALPSWVSVCSSLSSLDGSTHDPPSKQWLTAPS